MRFLPDFGGNAGRRVTFRLQKTRATTPPDAPKAPGYGENPKGREGAVGSLACLMQFEQTADRPALPFRRSEGPMSTLNPGTDAFSPGRGSLLMKEGCPIVYCRSDFDFERKTEELAKIHDVIGALQFHSGFDTERCEALARRMNYTCERRSGVLIFRRNR